MRYIVLVISLGGLVGSGVLGYVFMDNCNELVQDAAINRKAVSTGRASDLTKKELDTFDRRMKSWPFLFAGAGLGLVGALLAYERYRFSGAALLVCAGAGPLILCPFEHWVQGFCAGLVVAGLLALFIRRKVYESDLDDEDARPGPRKARGPALAD
jgi:hypothetical protein